MPLKLPNPMTRRQLLFWHTCKPSHVNTIAPVCTASDNSVQEHDLTAFFQHINPIVSGSRQNASLGNRWETLHWTACSQYA